MVTFIIYHMDITMWVVPVVMRQIFIWYVSGLDVSWSVSFLKGFLCFPESDQVNGTLK